MANQKEKDNSILRRIYDRVSSAVNRGVSGISNALAGQERENDNDLSSTSEWAKANNATVSTGASSGAPTIKPDTDLSSTSSWGKSNKATVTTGASSGAPTISASEASLYKLDDQQNDLDKRRAVLRQSYAQGKYDLSTKEGRDNYRRDTMFTGFGTWKGQKSPMALLRRADRELKRGNKAQAQHWLDMHDELYGNKTRDKRMAFDLEALDEEQKRLDKRREEATRSMFAQKDEDLANKKLALQKEAAEREKKYQEWTKDFREKEFDEGKRQFDERIGLSREQNAADRKDAKERYDAEKKAESESQQRKAAASLFESLKKGVDEINKEISSTRDGLLKWAKQQLEAQQAGNEEAAKIAGAQVANLTKRLEELDGDRKKAQATYDFESSIRDLSPGDQAKRRSAFYGKTQGSKPSSDQPKQQAQGAQQGTTQSKGLPKTKYSRAEILKAADAMMRATAESIGTKGFVGDIPNRAKTMYSLGLLYNQAKDDEKAQPRKKG